MDNLPDKETIERYIKENDDNGDGQIDFNEFCDMMKKCETQVLLWEPYNNRLEISSSNRETLELNYNDIWINSFECNNLASLIY